MRRIIFIVLFVCLASLLLNGCGDGTTSSGDGDVLEISLSTAATTGTYYPLGAAFANVLNTNLSDVRVSSLASEGSVQNLNLMAEGEVNAAFTSTGPLYSAYHGINEFEGRPFQDVMVVAALYPNASHFIVSNNSNINTINDFVGTRFAPGAPGSVSQEISQMVLDAYELSFDDLNPEFVGFTEAINLLRNNQLDSLHYSTAVGTAGVIEATTTANAKLVSVDEPQIEIITEEYPMYFRHILTAGTYEGQDEDVVTLAQNGVFVVSKDMSDDVVYNITKTLWENIQQVRDTIAAAEYIRLETATIGLADIPLHPGAKRYYEEQGVLDGTN